MTEYFTEGDFRNPLKNWMKDNCHYPVYTYSQAVKCEEQFIEDLSLSLIDRSGKHGLARSELLHQVSQCGKFGECQEHKDTKEQRFICRYCQARKYHIPCAIRYRAGQGIEDLNQFMEIVKANDLWGFYKWEFTLPDEARKWIDKNPEDSKNFLKKVRKDAVSRTIKAVFGVNTKSRKLQPGFKILYHPASSGNPFKQSSHFHVLALPLLCDLEGSRTETFPKMIDHAFVKKLYKKNLDKVFKKYGLHDAVKDKYVVHLEYVERELESSVIHAFKYNNRSMSRDIVNKIQKVKVPEYDHYICVLRDTEKSVWIPCIKNKDEILDALEFILNPLVQVRMAYGFLNRIEKYSILLNIARDDYHKDENWIKLYGYHVRRVHRTYYDKDSGRLKSTYDIFIRRADSQEAWRKLKPDDIRGERACMTNRKLFRAIT